MKLPTVEGLKERLLRDEPSGGGLRRAAVAVILRGSYDPKVLLIKRAEVAGDPWSGQVAFPGGKAEAGDGGLVETAIREAREEVGIDLRAHADFLGYVGRFKTHTRTLEVFPAVFLLKGDFEGEPNREVASCRWVALARLREGPGAHPPTGTIRPEGAAAVVVDGYEVWGLTLRIISSLLR